MAKITDLAVVDAINGDEFLPIVQRGATKRATMSALRALIVPFLQNWYKGDSGNPGPAGNVAETIGQLRAAPTTNRTMFAGYDGTGSPMVWTTGDFAAAAARQPADYVAANGVPLANGAWVRLGAAGVRYIARSLDARLRDTISVKDYGAKGDGVADDTAAVNVAMDAAIEDGTTLYFPAGNYRTTAPIAKRLKAIGFNSGGRQFNIVGSGRANSFITYDGPTDKATLSITGNHGSFDLFKIEGIGFLRPDAGYLGMSPATGEALRLTALNMVKLQDILTFRNGMGIHFVGCLNVFINGYYSCYERNGIFGERGNSGVANNPYPNANQFALRDFNFVQTSEIALHIKDGTGITLNTGAFESIGREPRESPPGNGAPLRVSPIGLYLEDCGLDGPHVLSGNSSVYVEANLGIDVLIKQRAIDANYDFRGWNFNRAGGPNDRTVNAIRFDASTLPAGVCKATINVDGVHFNKYGPYTPSVLTPAIEARLGGGSGQRFDGLTLSDLNTSYPDTIERPAYLDDSGNPIAMAPVSRPTEISVSGRILGNGAIEDQRGVRSIEKLGTGTYELTLIKGVTGLSLTATSNTPGVNAYTYAEGDKQRVECRGPDGIAQMDAVITLIGSYA